MKTPLVSVVCLCYNHARFVEEAIQSVLNQRYPNVQLIVIDDHSTDKSIEAIDKFISGNKAVEFVPLPSNLGNCRAFNIGLEKAKGDFIIDLAGDDVLMPDRIEMGVRNLESLGKEVGVQFSDAELINENGAHLGYHSDRFRHDSIPQGDIYKEVLSRYFINSPTMMMRRQVLEELGGYDGALAYEDFDFWVRSSRICKYSYIPEPLVRRRILSTSLGQRQYRTGSDQLRSTLTVCRKAFDLNKTEDEHAALRKRIVYEMRRAMFLGEIKIGWEYWKLWGTTRNQERETRN